MSVQNLLHDNITTHDLVVYDNIPKKKIRIPKCDVLLFTSPLNAKCYFDHYKLTTGQKIIAIGKTTLSTLKKLGINDVRVLKKPSEDAMKEMILKLFR